MLTFVHWEYNVKRFSVTPASTYDNHRKTKTRDHNKNSTNTSNKLTCAWTRWGSMCSWNIGNTAVIISSCDIKDPTLLLSRWTREIRWEWTPPTCFQATNYFQDSSSNKELLQFKPRKWIIWFITRYTEAVELHHTYNSNP